jgi:hypothetical protein
MCLVCTVQAFVSEYAVTGNDAGRGTLVAALAEAAFLIGLERNRSFASFMAFLGPVHFDAIFNLTKIW